MTNTFYLTKEIEVKTNITIVKKDSLYYAVMEQEGYNTTEIVCFIDKFGQADADECETDDQWNAVTETFQNYIIANGVKFARKCTCCGKGMNEGYFADYEYFCDNDCLYTEFPPEIWAKVTAEDEDSYYWTEWEDDNDYEYVLFNNQLIEL